MQAIRIKEKLNRAFIQNPKSSWILVITLFTFLIGLFASAQELTCKLSFTGDSFKNTVHSANQHSKHCITHQDPLPELDTIQTSSSTSFNSLSHLKVIVAVLSTFFFDAKLSSINSFASYEIKPHGGVLVYKFLAHYLI